VTSISVASTRGRTGYPAGSITTGLIQGLAGPINKKIFCLTVHGTIGFLHRSCGVLHYA
jgi:hypothetical protein